MNKSTKNHIVSGNLAAIRTYQAGITQAAVNRTLQRLCDDALRPYGLTKTQWFVLGMVWDAGTEGARVTDLARSLDTTMAFLTVTLGYLENKGLVERVSHASDSRSRLVRIAELVEPQLEEIENTLRLALRESIYSGIDVEEFLVYMKVMYELAGVDNAE